LLPIVISHGSGGIGNCELKLKKEFEELGHEVILNDYFSPHGIDCLYWTLEDEHDVTLQEMIYDIPFPDECIHIGLSLGGYLGLVHSEKFVSNHIFYPGMLGFTKEILSKDYSNTTVYSAELDNWCDNITEFCDQAKNISHIRLANCYHGFMNKNNSFEVIKPIIPLEEDTRQNTFNMSKTIQKYPYKEEKIRLQYSENAYIMCMNMIKHDINENTNNST